MSMWGEMLYWMSLSGNIDYTQSESQPGQRSPERKRKKKSLRKGHLNRLKMRMLSALKGDKYR